MNKILWSALLTLTLTACGTTSGTKATVEDRTGSEADAAVTAPAKAAGSGAETTALDGKGVGGSAIDGGYTGDPRKNPASPLSSRSVYFDYDQFGVKAEYQGMLEAHAGYLMSKRDARVTLQGNADERGSREYNLALGQKRAEAVRKALTVLGVSDAQIEAVSFGEEKPRKEGDTEEAYAENRRADVVYADE
ncbi:MAG: peptidoglycan-associated lipoprotein [Hydrogenophilales bacterium 17-61-9]|nr:MAG: peptidoglycan-associated lipoprotein [Hydrogenophilales bacterium 17-61-9]